MPRHRHDPPPHHRPRGHDGQSGPGETHLPEILGLEAEALAAFTAEQAAWVAHTVSAPPRHVVDLGSGTGAGTFALLERFPDARVSAVDSSPAMLEHLRLRAAELGADERLTTLRADLDEAIPPLEGVDLAWASSAVHHLDDPDRLLAEVAALLPAGGWFVVVEAEDVPWFLPGEIGTGRAGLEGRCHELLARRRSAALPEVGADWGARLGAAGLDVRAARVFEADVAAPLPEPARRYAGALFGVFRQAAREQLDDQDLAALDVLLDDTDPAGLARREDLTLRTTRTAWAAQRPASTGGCTTGSTGSGPGEDRG